MKFHNIHHIYFDLDHTLWDFDRNSALTFEAIFREEKIEVCLPEFLEKYVPINNNYWKLYRENKISQQDLRTGRLQDCFQGMNMDVSSQVIENLSNNYIKFLPGYNNLLEDTLEVLDYLYPKYKLHIITNGFEEVQRAKLLNSRISDYFATVTTSEEAGVKKPHSDIFYKALEKSNASPVNSIMVGDNYEADISGALKVGMHTLFFDYYQLKERRESPGIQKLKELMLYL